MVLGLKRTPFNRQNTEGMDPTISPNSSCKDHKSADYSQSARTTGQDVFDELDIDEGLIHFQQNHRWDPNLPVEYANRVHEALKAHDVEAELAIERGLAEQSPYPEVQAAVRNYDEVRTQLLVICLNRKTDGA